MNFVGKLFGGWWNLFSILVQGFIFSLFLSIALPWTKALILGVIGAMYFLHIFNSIDKVSLSLRNLAYSIENPPAKKKKWRYRSEYVFQIHWGRIIEDLAKESGKEYVELIQQFSKEHFDGSLSTKWSEWPDGSLGRNWKFRFIKFSSDCADWSDLWSEYHKNFVESINIYGYVIGEQDKHFKLRSQDRELLCHRFEIDDQGARFSKGYTSAKTILRLPRFHELNQFFKILSTSHCTGSANWGNYEIKKFPAQIRVQIEKLKLEYFGVSQDSLSSWYEPLEVQNFERDSFLSIDGDTDDPEKELKDYVDGGLEVYNRYIDWHVFKTYYSSFAIRVFSSP